jgi:hypothetical protein
MTMGQLLEQREISKFLVGKTIAKVKVIGNGIEAWFTDGTQCFFEPEYRGHGLYGVALHTEEPKAT